MNLLENLIFILNEMITVTNCIFMAILFFNYKVSLKLQQVYMFLFFLVTCFIVKDDLARLIIGMLYEFCFFITIIGKRKKTAIIFGICIILEMFIQIVIELLLSAYLPHQFAYAIYSKIITLLIVVALYTLRGIYFKKKNSNNSRTISFFSSFNLIINLIFASCPLLALRFLNLSNDIVMIEYVVLFCTVVVLSNVLSYLFYCTHVKKNIEFQIELASKEKSLSLQKKYTDEVIRNYESLRVFKHDINAKLGTFDYLIANKKFEELKELTCSVKKELTNTNLYSVDIYISATINQFIDSIKFYKIDFDFADHLTRSLDMEGAHICTLLYNLLKNAIEAVVKCDENKKIKLLIREYNHTLIIQIENSVNDNFDIKNIQNKITTKMNEELHGFGLLSINEIVNMYHGKIDYLYENNNVVVNVYLLNVI
ncbi:sensor histidine kinase [Thomasclavelia sp.]